MYLVGQSGLGLTYPAEDRLHQGLKERMNQIEHVAKERVGTKRHFNLLSDPFNTHEGERDNGDNGYCCPA